MELFINCILLISMIVVAFAFGRTVGYDEGYNKGYENGRAWGRLSSFYDRYSQGFDAAKSIYEHK